MSSTGRLAAQGLISDYLLQIEEATARLSPDARTELLTQLGDHIRDARAGLNDDDVDGVRAILDSLGTPAQIAAAALNEPDLRPGDRTGAERHYDLIAVLLLSVGSLCVPVVGWLAGVYMLWNGPRWTLRDKLLGTLVWPLGPGGLLIVRVLIPLGGSGGVCALEPPAPCTTESAPPMWLGYLAVGPYLPLAVVLSTTIVCFHLAKRARRSSSRWVATRSPTQRY